jgi:hypothetical protein
MEKRKIRQSKMITRRSFMKGAAYGSLGLVAGLQKAIPGVGGAAPSAQAFAAADPLARIILVRDEAAVDEAHAVNAKLVASMVDRAVMTLAGEKDALKAWGRYIKPGDTVGVKITRCEWMRVHTEQAVIDAVLARLDDLGIPQNRVFAMDGGLPAKDCTALINLPSIKVHTLIGMACSMKNYINLSPKPSAYHFDGNSKLGELFLLPEVKGKTRLILVDALRPYFGPGPQINPLHRWDYKGVMAGTDPVAVDTTALALCMAKRRLFKGEEWPVTPPPRFLAAADKEYKLGTSDPARIKVEKLGWDKDLFIGA